MIPSGISISIVGIEGRRGGDEAVLTVVIRSGANEEQKKLTLSSKMLFEVGNIGPGNLPYELNTEQYDTLEYNAGLWEAVKKGLDLMAYGDNTRQSLIKKLRLRGFDKYLSQDAAEYIAKMGIIDESRMLCRLVDQLANVKLYGPMRIKNELYKKGIDSSVLKEELPELLCEIDFEENVKKLLRRKCDFERLSEGEYRESLYGSMYRMGYSPGFVRAAVKAVIAEDEEPLL